MVGITSTINYNKNETEFTRVDIRFTFSYYNQYTYKQMDWSTIITYHHHRYCLSVSHVWSNASDHQYQQTTGTLALNMGTCGSVLMFQRINRYNIVTISQKQRFKFGSVTGSQCRSYCSGVTDKLLQLEIFKIAISQVE